MRLLQAILPEAFDAFLDQFGANARNQKYKDDPVLWAKEIAGVDLWSKQREIVESVRDNQRTTVRAANGPGKDVPLDTPLPTPTGWTTMGKVQVGDYLLDEQGKPTRVTFKSDILHSELYEITFNDGATQIASGTHEWDTIDKSSWSAYRNRGNKITDYRDLWDLAKTRTTLEIKDTLEKWGGRNHYVPVNKPLDLPEADLPIDPYVLGVWLGDGSSHGPYVTLGGEKQHIVDDFRERGIEIHSLPSAPITYTFARQGFMGAFRDLGVLNNKHIPVQYLRASYRQRLGLLRGIMDTDGFTVRGNRKANVTGVGIDLMNKDLADGVAELVRSLGARCSIKAARAYLNGEDVGTRYRMNFNPVFDPFTPGSPKSARRPDAGQQQSRKTVRTIVSVEPVPTVPTACVQVDSPRHLYLCGEHMIPTHNTFCASVVAAWFVAVNDPNETIVITTAPSFPQIKTNMFFELSARKRQVEERIKAGVVDPAYALPGKINTSGNIAEWKLPNGNQLALGRKPAEHEIITTFQGIHRKNVLFVIDEAGGMPIDMFVAAERMTTNKNAKILAIGNPDRRGSEFYRMFYDENVNWRWNKLHISAYDTPAFTGEPCPQELLENLPNQEWVDSNLKAWGGPDDPRAKISIFGDFPDSDESVFFSESAMSCADDTVIDPELTKPRVMGIDLSMFGSDESMAYINHDNKIRHLESWGQLGTQAQAEKIHRLAMDNDIDFLNIDSGGIGAPIISLLKSNHPMDERNYRIVEMNAAAAAPDKRRWVNARAWWYDRLREDMVLGKVDMEIPRGDNLLRKQLTAIQYEIAEGNKAGAIKMESKKDMKARVGYSPDHVDAAVFCHMTPEELEDADMNRRGAVKRTEYESPDEVLDEVPDYLQAIESVFTHVWI